ncbi:MAG: SpoIID/LytB domain-containing protein [Gemmatimonadales bacterium]|nr:SpoIID/LytB domain-containing protein [Gemmatimonadales bacterium]NIN12097.1 SpoIID/LytB domain-containing protein [Gemmatimonadales bacterium]NIR03332.1 SpoIID/LytB domain-containing protein [Gemmatimonadales bacterium]NIS67012.1 SpoIID/LytB domain-containing protein [Gemmatimonadales bacterium]
MIPDQNRVRLQSYSGSRSERISFSTLDRARFVMVNDKPYRGSVEAYARGGTVTAVNVVGLEAYLRGVVTSEMGSGSRNELAALEAQAIASRTYALKNRGRFREEGYDIRASVSDQAYLGVERETPLGVEAVRRTAGLVLTYEGELIAPFFHSTCGYSTAAPNEAFRAVGPAPYLRPVSDRRPAGGYYSDISPRFRWTVEWEGSELRDILRRTIPSVLGIEQEMVDEIRNIHVRRRGPSGRVVELWVEVSRGAIPVFGPDLRQVLATPEGQPLGSTAIEVSTTKDAGRVERFRVEGTGWGHGVGMCQWGAVGRARAGQSAHTILATYFPGTRVDRR